MDYDSSTKFISSLAKFLQSLCNGYVEFDNGVQVIGHLYLSVDTGKTIDYVLNEKVCKTDENSVTFISNSFHAQPAERPKPQGKRTARDRQDVKSEDKDNNSVEQIEPRSTNHGTVQTARGSGENSPLGNNGKRPLSPSQRQFKDDASLSGRVSPRSKKSRTDSFDQNTSHPSNLNNENSISSAPSPAGDSGPASMSAQNSDAPQDSSYSESYQQQTFFPPSEEEHSVGGSERDIKPSLDTDVTFIKEEYAPSSCSQSDTQGRDRNQVEDSSMYPTMFPSSHSYPSGAYAGHGNYGASTPGSQRSNFSSSSDRHSGMYASGQSSTQLEPGENTSDPSGDIQREVLVGYQAGSSSRLAGSSAGDSGSSGVWPSRRMSYPLSPLTNSAQDRWGLSSSFNLHHHSQAAHAHHSTSSSSNARVSRDIYGNTVFTTCSKCGGKYTNPSACSAHEVNCTGHNRLMCHICQRVYSQMCALKEHLRGKHGLGKPLVCSLCGRSFKYKPQLYDHNCTGMSPADRQGHHRPGRLARHSIPSSIPLSLRSQSPQQQQQQQQSEQQPEANMKVEVDSAESLQSGESSPSSQPNQSMLLPTQTMNE
ncbi:transcription factor btd isoform X1 [Aplysia californica]|uniref:Transcription factor btd isoform X1 n=1 Tax=Aplysia californica TaxID=6500 RepID=A0ABM0JJ59_APLCA|nr:transcription factor btd isoform X1 [Aplysia californica]